MSSDPTTLLDILGVVSPVIAAGIAVGGVIGTIIFTNKRERDRQDQERALAKDRQEHERLLKDADLEAQREVRLRDERIAAYRKLLAATTNAHVEREGVETLAVAYAEISLLASTDEINRAAARVWTSYGKTQEVSRKTKKNPPEASVSDFAQALDEARKATDRFLVLACKELGIKGRSAGFRDLE